MIPGTLVTVVRGSTAFFSATFYDQYGQVTQPTGAAVTIQCQQDGADVDVSIDMVAPVSPSVVWTAEWDTRNIDPNIVVYWSIHSEGPGIPYAVADGCFNLVANNANLLTF